MNRRFPIRKSLTDELTASMTELIQAGALKPGEKLPTGQNLASQHGVSLTVVREAISRLTSEGLVVSRQGAGVFVAEPNFRRPFRFPASPESGELSTALVYELRMGVEVVAAGLAAKRRTKAQLVPMKTALDDMERAITAGEEAIEEDMNFHRALASATENPLFLSFIEFIGGYIRESIAISRDADGVQEVTVVAEEHRAIYLAVERQDEAGAQEAMRRHMQNCLTRCH